MKPTQYLFIFLLSGFLFSCNETAQNEKVRDSKDTAQTNTETPSKGPRKHSNRRNSSSENSFAGFSKDDQSFITALDTLKFGNNFNKVKTTFPILKGIRPEGGNDDLAAQGLTESKSSTTILGHPVEIEFNFKNDSLYSYTLSYNEKNYDAAEEVYDYLISYYGKKYGDCIKEKTEEENHFLKNCGWKAGKKFLVLHYDINEGTINWGYQKENPF